MPLITFPRKLVVQRDFLESLGDFLINEGLTKVLLISDKNVYAIQVERIKKGLEGIETQLFVDVSPEPTIEAIEDAFEKLRNLNVDGIVAFGGGSVIDFAKSVAVKLSDPAKNLREISPFEYIKLRFPLIAIPTTGSGSDASFATVLTDGTRKFPTGNYSLVPMFDILDSSVFAENSDLIRNTGVDAIVTAIEAVVSNTSNIMTDAIAEKSLPILFENLEMTMKGNKDNVDDVQLAMTMAGIAFSNSGSGLVHCLGHSFGSTFHIAHGKSVGIFLPYVIEFLSSDATTRSKYEYLASLISKGNSKSLIDLLKEFYKKIGQPLTVRDAGITKKDYEERMGELVEKAMEDSELAFNPIFVSNEDMKNLFEIAYDGDQPL